MVSGLSDSEIYITISAIFVAWGLFCYIMGMRYAAHAWSDRLEYYRQLYYRYVDKEADKEPW